MDSPERMTVFRCSECGTIDPYSCDRELGCKYDAGEELEVVSLAALSEGGYVVVKADHVKWILSAPSRSVMGDRARGLAAYVPKEGS